MRSKILITVLIMALFAVFTIHSIYGVGAYQVKVQPEASEVNPGDTVNVTFALTDISLDDGIGALTGKLEYDKTVFEKVLSSDITSGQGWGTVVYNDQNDSEGNFVVERAQGDKIKTDNNLFTVKMKVLSNAKLGDSQVTLSNLSASTGADDVTIENMTGTVRVVEKVPDGSYTFAIRATKAELQSNDTVQVTFALSNITLEEGIGAVSGKLVYDKSVFETVSSSNISAAQGWANVIYNSENTAEGNFIVERAAGDLIKENNDVFTVTFKVLSTAKAGTTEIKLQDISASTGRVDVPTDDVGGALRIVAPSIIGPTNTSTNTTTNTISNTNTNTNTNVIINPYANTTTNTNVTTNTATNTTTNTNTRSNVTTNTNVNKNTSASNTITSVNTKTNTTTATNMNNNQSTTANEATPNLGAEDYILPAMFVIMIIGAFAFIRYKKM